MFVSVKYSEAIIYTLYSIFKIPFTSGQLSKKMESDKLDGNKEGKLLQIGYKWDPQKEKLLPDL